MTAPLPTFAQALSAVLGEQLTADELEHFVTHYLVTHSEFGPFTLGDCEYCMTVVVRAMRNAFSGDPLTAAQADVIWAVVPAQVAAMFAPPPVGDVLDAVGDDGQMLCACGCRRPITDQSPSAYFAFQECSERWHAARYQPPAPEPVLIPQRPPARGAAPAPMTEPGAVPATAWLDSLSPAIAATAVIEVADGRIHVTIPADIYQGIAYTRQCPACRAVTPPHTVSGPHDPDDVVTLDDVSQRCTACAEQLPGPVYFGRVAATVDAQPAMPPHFRLYLDNGMFRICDVFVPDEAWWSGDPAATEAAARRVGRMWQHMERRLDRFAEAWRLHTGTPAADVESQPYAIDVPAAPPRLRRWRGGTG